MSSFTDVQGLFECVLMILSCNSGKNAPGIRSPSRRRIVPFRRYSLSLIPWCSADVNACGNDMCCGYTGAVVQVSLRVLL